MRFTKYFPALASVALLSGACTDDEKVVYNEANVVPSVITVSDANTQIVLTPETAGNASYTFEWSATDFGFSAAPTYDLQLDLAGQNFAKAFTLASTTDKSVEIKASALNSALMALQKAYENSFSAAEATAYELRIMASLGKGVNPVYSEVFASNITGYEGKVEYPKVWVIGDYCSWNHALSQFLFDYNASGEYVGYVGFDGKAANGFKLTGIAGWDDTCNWGTDGAADAPADEAASVTLISSGGSGNIQCYAKNFYQLKFNKETLELSVLNSFNALGVVGTINEWGAAPDVPFDFDAATQTFSAVVTVGAADEIKFRADADWAFNLGGADGKLSAGGANITLPAGTWRITLDINNPDECTYTLEEAKALDPANVTAPSFVTAMEAATSLARSSELAFAWNAVDFNGQDPVTVSYALQMADNADFENAVAIAETKDTSAVVLASAILEAIPATETGADVYFRVVATLNGVADLYISDVITSNFTILNAVALPTEMYMIGSMCGWSWDNAIALTPVNTYAGGEGIFWTIQYLAAGTEFKFCAVKEWKGDFSTPLADENYASNIEGGNIAVTAAGYYQIVVKVSHTDDTKQATQNLITISKPNVYLIGNCSDAGWTAGDASSKFTVDDESKLIVSPALAADGDVRMYVEVPGCDWWGSEFNVYDGAIVLRGNGGDQAPVAMAKGNVIELDFVNMTAAVK